MYYHPLDYHNVKTRINNNKQKKIYNARKEALRSKKNLYEAFQHFLKLFNKIFQKEKISNEEKKRNFFQDTKNHKTYSNLKTSKQNVFSSFVFCSDSIRNEILNSYIKNAMEKNLYKRFGCDSLSTKEQIKTQYKAISKIIHPDKNSDLSLEHKKLLTEAFQNLSVAFNKLMGK